MTNLVDQVRTGQTVGHSFVIFNRFLCECALADPTQSFNYFYQMSQLKTWKLNYSLDYYIYYGINQIAPHKIVECRFISIIVFIKQTAIKWEILLNGVHFKFKTFWRVRYSREMYHVSYTGKWNKFSYLSETRKIESERGIKLPECNRQHNLWVQCKELGRDEGKTEYNLILIVSLQLGYTWTQWVIKINIFEVGRYKSTFLLHSVV